jgi:cytochrome c-type biogenesis protein CcmH/NrfG
MTSSEQMRDKKRDDSKKIGSRSKSPAPKAGMARWVSSPRRAAAVVFAVSVLLYANTVGHDFVWDDRDLIVDNAAVRVLDGSTVEKIFTEDFWRSSQLGGGYYRPLVTLSYHVHYKVFDGDPAGFHLVNVLWNAVTCALVFAFVYLLFGNVVFGFVSALLFAAHPIHTENVAWVAGRTDVLSTMWAMASLVFYVLAKRRRNWWWLAAALAAFMLSLLAKESSAFVPLVILLMEVGPFGRLLAPSKRSWVAPVLYAAVLVAYLLQRRAVIGEVGTTYDAYAPGVLGTVALPLSILAGYAFKLVFPFQLNGEYDAPVPETLAAPHAAAGLLVLAAVVIAAIRFRRRPDVVLGAAVFLLGLGPVSNLIPIGEISAERFLYFPSLGFAIVMGGLFSSALTARYPSWRAAAGDGYVSWPGIKPSLAGKLTILFAVILVAFGARTVSRNNDWKTEEILFAKTAQASPKSARAQLNVGNVARRQGRLSDAADAYTRALQIAPDYPDALSNLAWVYASQGRIDDAQPLIERALEQAPDDVTLLNNLGSIYFQKKQFDDAAPYFERSIELDPEQAIAHYNLALIRNQQGNRAAAYRHFDSAASGGPRFVRAYYYMAVIDSERGNAQEAKSLARRFLELYDRNDSIRERAQSIAAGKN